MTDGNGQDEPDTVSVSCAQCPWSMTAANRDDAFTALMVHIAAAHS